MKSSTETGAPSEMRTRTTFAPVGGLRFHEPWKATSASPRYAGGKAVAPARKVMPNGAECACIVSAGGMVASQRAWS